MLQRATEFKSAQQVPLPIRARRLLWAVVTLDVMAASWMIAAGDWLDHYSRVTSVVTLGGHHIVVLWLALIGFAILAVLAPMTNGFAAANRVELVALSIAGVASVAAFAGMISVAALVAGVAGVIAIIGRAVIR
ncbi:hypothetical protein K1T35_10035 [Pseudonocardia sp. DSM 110487]|uniref:hypothetical protein n=1 Tax=Pseudonocardia sp. DSM 110487 TaxID=2865833 RepID=UPI001C6A1AC9|nr:hypothetical protein [Pseudonocardia sp. DSM 110487]QYN37540.1 hypothetical protein K1T35_10035 [Pseudonocardia sp. DSM 110487]